MMDNVTEFYDRKDGCVAGIKGIMAPRVSGEPSKRDRCNAVYLKKL